MHCVWIHRASLHTKKNPSNANHFCALFPDGCFLCCMAQAWNVRGEQTYPHARKLWGILACCYKHQCLVMGGPWLVQFPQVEGDWKSRHNGISAVLNTLPAKKNTFLLHKTGKSVNIIRAARKKTKRWIKMLVSSPAKKKNFLFFYLWLWNKKKTQRQQIYTCDQTLPSHGSE